MNQTICATLSLLLTLFWMPLEASLRPGKIVIGAVTGNVHAVDVASGNVRSLQPGDTVGQDAIVVTGEASRTTLLFSNGSTLTLKPSSQIEIEQYLHSHSPADAEALEQIVNEPGISKASLRLREGDIVGSVRKLNREAGSEFNIHSLNYTAGIRGTRWWMKLRVDATRNLNWGFGIAEGSGHVKDPGGQTVVLDEQSVINLSGILTEAEEIQDANIQAGSMPGKQFDAITNVTTQAEELFELYEAELFFEEIIGMP